MLSLGGTPTTRHDALCPVCGAQFLAIRKNSKTKQARWQRCCSRRCAWALRHHRLLIACEECGHVFTDTPSARRRFCSRPCYRRHRFKRKIGAYRHDASGYVFTKAPEYAVMSLKRSGSGTPPERRNWGWVYAHRVVMAQQLGRALYPFEHVHHKNGQRADNRPENLEVWIRGHPTGVPTLYTAEIIRLRAILHTAGINPDE